MQTLFVPGTDQDPIGLDLSVEVPFPISLIGRFHLPDSCNLFAKRGRMAPSAGP
jgi:hypothetical protein